MNCEERNKMHELRFRKAERLRLRSLVEGLFAEGNGMYDFPLRMVWRRISPRQLQEAFRNGTPRGIHRLQMMVTVPKKKRRHAVDRVLMRRRIREAYRLNRMPLSQTVRGLPDGSYIQIAFIYLHNENLPYADIERRMQRLLAKLQSVLCTSEPSSDTSC